MGKKLKSALTLTIFGLAAAIAVWTIAEKPDTSYADDTADNIMTYEEAWLANDGEKIALALVKELPDMVSDYNKLDITDKIDYKDTDWKATSIEYYRFVYIIENNDYGLYVDFDGNNGYAVCTRDRIAYGLAVEGDLDYVRETSEVYFSYYDGFMYMDDDGQLEKFGHVDIEDVMN